MKTSLGKLAWKIAKYFLLILLLFAAIGAAWLAFQSQPDRAAQKAAADTRQVLRAQGYKTDLTDFDFSTTPELRAREAILKSTASNRFSGSLPIHPNLLPPVGNNSAMVVWKLDSLKRENRSSYDDSDQLSWEEFRDAVNQNQSLYDPACAAILSGPIRFNLDASRGSAMLLPHLAVMKNLAQTFGDRTVLALHDGNLDAAFTNLLASSRLVTAWEPESAEVSHLVRLACAVLTYNTVWQALQTNGWTDDQLAQLQTQWEGVDFFKLLPAAVAFQRACAVAQCEQDRNPPAEERFSWTEFSKEALHHPSFVLPELTGLWQRSLYLKHGSYDDETNLLTFYRERELELRNAIQAPTWFQMRALPGVTNKISFQSKFHSRVQAMINLRGMSLAMQRQGTSFLGRAAEVEAERRVLITALALERYRGKQGAYPPSLAELTPEFLKTPPPDFIDGQPLRYRLTDDGHFLLYSIGLDGVDNGGKIRQRMGGPGFERPQRPGAAQQEYDLVWPVPASEAAIMSAQREQQTMLQRKEAEMEQLQSTTRWADTARRQLEAARLLQQKPPPASDNRTFRKIPLADFLRKPTTTGTNKLSLAQLLTLKPVITGMEPEIVTFEIPIRLEALTNVGGLSLFVDRYTDQGLESVISEGIADCSRSTNGDCLFNWSTIYEARGLHAVQASLTLISYLNDQDVYINGNNVVFGPMCPFTLTNLCQFSLSSATYDVESGARFHARLPEKNGIYSIECVTTNGAHLTTLTGSTTNGEFNVVWNLVDDHGQRLHGETFNSIVHITLPDSGREQTLRGP